MRKFNITVNGVAYEVEVEEVGEGAAAAPQKTAAPAPKAAPVAQGTKVSAPMPGTILEVKVKQGQQVKQGDLLVILEAMKMENEILAPQDGTVAQINVGKGASVNSGDVLAVLA